MQLPVFAAVSFGAMLASSPAGATGFMVARFGGEQGTPMTSNPTAMYYNPAGLAFARGTRVYVENFFVYRHLSYDRPVGAIDHNGKTPGTLDATVNSGSASLNNFLVSPFLGVTSDLGSDRLGVGLGFYTPFGGQAKWGTIDKWKGDSQYPGAVDGVQRWHDIEGEIKSIYVTAAGAYRILDNLSIGLGANLVISNVNDLRASNADGSDDVLITATVPAEGRAWLDVTNMTFSLGVGVLYQPMPSLSIGLSYQSQPGFGEMKYSGTVRKKLGLGATTEDNVDYRHGLPDIIRLGVSYRPTTSLELRLWGSYERWSHFENMCILNADMATRACEFGADGVPAGANPSAVINNIPRHWKDAAAVRVSGSYWTASRLELQAGLGFDGNAVPDSTQDVSLPDENEVTVALGVIFPLLEDRLHITTSAFGVIGLGREVAVRARNASGEAISPYNGQSRVPDAAGKYGSFIGVFQLGAEYKF